MEPDETMEIRVTENGLYLVSGRQGEGPIAPSLS